MKDLMESVTGKVRRFDGVVIDVEHWRVQLPNHGVALREVVLHKGASAVVPVDKSGRVAMVHQFRTPIERLTLEIPAGKLDYAGEDPLECAKRELREETGLSARKWQKLVALRTTPGFCNETIHIYLARDLLQGEDDPDEDEFLNMKWIPLEEITSRILRGEIEDSKTIAAILMTREILMRERTD